MNLPGQEDKHGVCMDILCATVYEGQKIFQQAENIAVFMTLHKNLPKDLVPYYDFDAPGIPE